jgi:hypothetical protein
MVVDECQQVGAHDSVLCDMLCAVKAQRLLLMSGERACATRCI